MSSKYKFDDIEGIYFATSTVVDWIDVFTRDIYRDILLDSFRYQFWKHENHPVLLNNIDMYNQRFNYLHENPERAGFVKQPQDWKHSSAIDYYTENGKGLLELIRLD